MVPLVDSHILSESLWLDINVHNVLVHNVLIHIVCMLIHIAHGPVAWGYSIGHSHKVVGSNPSLYNRFLKIMV